MYPPSINPTEFGLYCKEFEDTTIVLASLLIDIEFQIAKGNILLLTVIP